MSLQSWTVSDAKTHLSEILRLARTEAPQQIGEKKPCIVISADEWEKITGQKPSLGRWLVKNLGEGCDLELPSRDRCNRDIPFQGCE